MVKFGVDGRTLTDWRPNCEVNRLMKQQVGAGNNFNYRLWLQRNATNLMQAERKAALVRNKTHCNCPQCVIISNR